MDESALRGGVRREPPPNGVRSHPFYVDDMPLTADAAYGIFVLRGGTEVAEKKPCEVMAMVVAERVFREEDTHNVHIASTFNQINAKTFPATHPRMHVYLAIDGVAGKREARVIIRYCDAQESDADLAAAATPVEFSGARKTAELNVVFQGVTFPRPGSVDVIFFLDGVRAASRRLEIAQV